MDALLSLAVTVLWVVGMVLAVRVLWPIYRNRWVRVLIILGAIGVMPGFLIWALVKWADKRAEQHLREDQPMGYTEYECVACKEPHPAAAWWRRHSEHGWEYMCGAQYNLLTEKGTWEHFVSG